MKKSSNPKLFNEDGSINKEHELTVAEVVELLACALSDIPAYNWFNRHSFKPKEEANIDGNFISYNEYVLEMYKDIAEATKYVFDNQNIVIGRYANKKNKTIKK